MCHTWLEPVRREASKRSEETSGAKIFLCVTSLGLLIAFAREDEIKFWQEGNPRARDTEIARKGVEYEFLLEKK